MKSLRGLAAVFANLAFFLAAPAQEPIRFARMPDISPDGKQIAFSYLGDVWTVETIGGVARPVTSHEAHDTSPIFSPDGRSIAFSSNRHGSYDVFVVSAHGGKPRRITFDSAQEVVSGWSPDGKRILFTTRRGVSFPPVTELCSISATGGREQKVSAWEGRDGVYSPQGDQIAYVAGPGTWYRKGYRGSANDDIWISDANGQNNRRLTEFNGQDGSPMWSADGQTIFYVSEQFGVSNICRTPVGGGSSPQPITRHTDDGVREARLSANGDWIVYECGADLWVCSTQAEPNCRRVAIEAFADDKTNPERTVSFEQGISEYELSPNEQFVAIVVHGEIFLMPVSGGKAKRLTEHPGNDHDIAWSRDMKKLLFVSDRGGEEDIYVLEHNDPEHPELVRAHSFKVTQLTKTAEPESGVSFSPDGKLVAFLRGGRLWTMNPDGTNAKQAVKEPQVIEYEWSPDSKWLVYSRMDGHFAGELYLMPVAGGKAENITRYATRNFGVSWSSDGKKLAFISQRRQDLDVFVMSMQKPVIEGEAGRSFLSSALGRTAGVDFDDIHKRIERATSMSSDESEAAIKPDGSQVVFRSNAMNGDDLWMAYTNGSQVTRLTVGNLQPNQVTWTRSGTIYFLDGRGALRFVRPAMISDPNPGRIAFTAKMKIARDELFLQMFDEGWRKLSHRFYDPTHHGANWIAVRLKYRPLVKHVSMHEDFYDLVSLMLGELNASHLGISGYSRMPEEQTAELGLLWDETYRGQGLRIKEILRRGPADRRGLTLKLGEYVMAINGVELTDAVNLSQLLNEKANDTVILQVVATTEPSKMPHLQQAGALASSINYLNVGWSLPILQNPAALFPVKPVPPPRRKVEIRPVSRNAIDDLMYERWVANNARRVQELSGGKLGYIHIKQMDTANLDEFVRTLYSDNFDKDAIVLDVRYNGGGYTHDQVLNYLGGKEHTYFQTREGTRGMVLRANDRKWTKPLVLLCNNRSYSDAEIFPNAFRSLGLGKLVGVPTGGYVIGTYNDRLIDGSMFRVPRLGVYAAGTNVNMEKVGVTPDFVVETHPDQLAKGHDAQLDKAVDVLTKDVEAWRKSRTAPTTVANPAAGSLTVPTATPVKPAGAGK